MSRLDLPVDLDVLSERLPPDIEASAYFIVAEALTNVVKHARATQATVRAAADNGVLTLEVRDDGVGGADPDGHGLMGIADRVDALGGRLRIESTDGDGTVLAAQLPLSTGGRASRTPVERPPGSGTSTLGARGPRPSRLAVSPSRSPGSGRDERHDSRAGPPW